MEKENADLKMRVGDLEGGINELTLTVGKVVSSFEKIEKENNFMKQQLIQQKQ